MKKYRKKSKTIMAGCFYLKIVNTMIFGSSFKIIMAVSL